MKTRVLLLSMMVMLFTVSVSLLVLANDTSSETAYLTDPLNTSMTYAESDLDWTLYFRPGIRLQDHRVIGYYDLLVPLYPGEKSVLFFNPRFSHDDRSSYEWNLGLGYRHLLMGDKLILGGNVYYDWRHSWTGEEYHQLGLGVEVLTEWVNARANGYLTLSDEQEIDRWREYYFTSTAIAYSIVMSLEEAM